MTLTYGILFYSLLHYSVLILLTSNTVRLVGKDVQTKLITSMFYRVNIQWLTPWLMRNRSNPNSTCKHNPNHTKTWSFIIYLLYYTVEETFHSIPFFYKVERELERLLYTYSVILTVHVKLQRIGGMVLEPQRHQSTGVCLSMA